MLYNSSTPAPPMFLAGPVLMRSYKMNVTLQPIIGRSDACMYSTRTLRPVNDAGDRCRIIGTPGRTGSRLLLYFIIVGALKT